MSAVPRKMNPPAVLVISAAIALAGCAATSNTVRVDQAEQVDLSTCRSFAWLPASDDAASLTEQRVQSAATRELEQKGYTFVREQPDCRITYVLETREQPQQKPSVGVGAGGGSRGVGGGIGVSLPIGRGDRYVGDFSLDVIDAARNAQIWRGSIEAAFRGAELTEDEAVAAVEDVLTAFPDAP
jgi:Domain of unknown function (DUF4136)